MTVKDTQPEATGRRQALDRLAQEADDAGLYDKVILDGYEGSYADGFIDGLEHGYAHCGSCSHPWEVHDGECKAYENDGSICGCKKVIIDQVEPAQEAKSGWVDVNQELLDALKRAYRWMKKIDSSHQTEGIPFGLEADIYDAIKKAESLPAPPEVKK